MNQTEVSRIKLVIDGTEGEETLKSLKAESKEINDELKRMKDAGEVGSEAWKELKNRQVEVNAELKSFKNNIDINDASMTELTVKSRHLHGELKNLKAGSEEWIAKMDEIGRTEARMEEVRKEMARLKQEALENSDAYKELQKRQEELNQEMREAVKNIDLNDASLNQLTAKSKLLNEELKDLKVGTAEWVAKMKEIAEVDERIGEVNEEMDELRDTNDKNALSWTRVKEAALGTFAAFSLEDIIQEVVQFGKEAVNSATEMSDAMSDIEKATDMTTQEVEGLVASIQKIDTRTAVEDLTDIAVVAGQLGIAKNEVLGFVESVDRAVVALGDEFTGGAEEVASTIGGLQKLFKETKDLEAGKAINDIGSALNALGAAGSATAPVVADFTARMGQLGDLSPQINETMGLGAAFQELGLSAEIASGGLSNILLGAAKDTAAFAQQLGISEVEMKKLINTDPNTFLLKLAESLRGLPTDQVTKRLDDLGIKSQEATKVMSLLKDQTDLVGKYQKLAGEEMRKGTSLTDEFNKKNTNAAAEMAKMGKEIKALSLSFGQALLPVVLKVGEVFIAFIKTIQAAPKFINDNKAALALLAIGLVTFNAQAIAAATASLALAAAEKGRAIATSAVTVAQNALNVAMKANPIGLIITALTLLASGLMYAYNNSETFRGIVNGLWAALKTGIGVVTDLWNTFSDWISETLSPLAGYLTPIKSALSALWDNMTAGVSILRSIGSAIASFFIGGLESLGVAIQPIRTAVQNLWNVIASGINTVMKVGQAFAEFLHVDKLVDKATQAGKQIGTSFTKAYDAETTKARAADLAGDKAHNDQKASQANASAKAAAGHQAAVNKGALAGMATDNTEHLSKEEKKAQDHARKVADDKKKANQDANEAIRKASIEAIADEQSRKLAQLAFDRDKEIQRIQESQASQSLKRQQEEAANQAYETKKAAMEKEFRDKKAKEGADLEAQMEKVRIAAITNDRDRKVAELTAQATREKAEIERSKLDEAQKAEALKLINEKLQRDIARANEEGRQNDLKKNEEKRQKEKASNDALFDAQYKAAVMNADLNLELARNNSQAILEAKKQKLQLEYEYNKKKLQDEADEEKRKNQELITDADARAKAEHAIDERLRAQLKAGDIQFQNEKTALNQEHLERRRQNTEQFFGAINGLMQGDYSAFMGFLGDKLKNDAAANNQRLQDFAQKGQETLAVGSQVIDSLKQVNQKFLESQLAKIEKEKQAQLKSWDAQYKAGTINKEEYEKGIAEIDADADERVKAEKLKAFKREQTLQIASALVNAAQAALKSMAIMGFPLGLIGVGVSAAMAAIQIGIIKSQKPPSFAKGGASYVKNAGVVRGSRHGSSYGQAGISMVDRVSGQEVGEMEGDEPFMILSRDTYKNNGKVIDMLLHSSLHRNGAKIFRDGGIGSVPETPYAQKGMYLFGSKKAKKAAKEAEAQAAAAQAEAEEMQRQAEAEAAASSYGGGVPSDGVYVPGADGDPAGTVAATNEQIQASQEMMGIIGDNTEATVDQLGIISTTLNALLDESKGQTGLLGRIASKDLSVSVHNVVNVMNQINVVAGDSNLK